MKIGLASDHAAFHLKTILIDWLSSKGYETIDYGTHSDDSVDYPDFALAAAKAVAENQVDFGIIMCGTGIGMSIVSNKVTGIRAALCCSTQMAELARKHNNANILNMGARLIDPELAKKITETFLNAQFEGGRHKRRVEKIHNLTKK